MKSTKKFKPRRVEFIWRQKKLQLKNNNNIKRVTLSEKQQEVQTKDSQVPLKTKKNNSWGTTRTIGGSPGEEQQEVQTKEGWVPLKIKNSNNWKMLTFKPREDA